MKPIYTSQEVGDSDYPAVDDFDSLFDNFGFIKRSSIMGEGITNKEGNMS